MELRLRVRDGDILGLVVNDHLGIAVVNEIRLRFEEFPPVVPMENRSNPDLKLAINGPYIRLLSRHIDEDGSGLSFGDRVEQAVRSERCRPVGSPVHHANVRVPDAVLRPVERVRCVPIGDRSRDDTRVVGINIVESLSGGRLTHRLVAQGDASDCVGDGHQRNRSDHEYNHPDTGGGNRVVTAGERVDDDLNATARPCGDPRGDAAGNDTKQQ